MAAGRYVAYLGHDDLWHPQHLETMVARIEEAEADLVYAITLWLGPPEDPFRHLSGIEPASGHRREINLPPSSLMHERGLAERMGGWRDHRTLSQAPNHDFVSRVWDLDHSFCATDRLTVLKFPSTARSCSYVSQPSYEQAEYLARMASEPGFIERELIETIRLTHTPRPADEGWAPGELVRLFRRMRGLEPPPPEPALSGPRRLLRAVRRRLRPLKVGTRWLLERVDRL
jgi:hypothetical protein